jgi:hypothetical protein
VGVRRIDLPSHSSFKHERAVSAELDLEIGFALVVICVAKMPPRTMRPMIESFILKYRR